MKIIKFLAIAIILLLSMFVMEGCASNKSETAQNDQQTSGTPQTPNQQSGSIPQPPALPEG